MTFELQRAMDEDLGRCSIQAFWNCTGCSKVPFPGCHQTSCHVTSGHWNCRIGYPKDGSICSNGWLIKMKSTSTFLSETGTLQNTFRDTVQWHIRVYQRDAAEWTSNSSRQRMSKQQTHARIAPSLQPKHRSIGELAATPKNNHLQKVARCCQQLV